MSEKRTVQPGDLAHHATLGTVIVQDVALYESGTLVACFDRVQSQNVPPAELTPIIPAEKLPALLESHAELLSMCERLFDHLNGCSHGWPDDLWDDTEDSIIRAQELTRE